MQYPLISEYIEAIRSAEDNFDKLSNLRPVLDSDGNPMMSSGNFAVVFKMEDVATHRLFAVKCFIKEQEGRGERYALIAEELQYVSSSYLLHVRYLERELFVSTAGCDEEEFPVLVMDWVEGQPLDIYLKQHLNNRYDLEMLAYRFCKMGAWLLSQPFAHGDLKPDNILVREDGSLVLVDYDGMYVSAMKGQTAAEMGSPDFRHPLRTEKDFNEHIDDFSIASIALSLKAVSLDSQLYSQYAAADRLLFSAADYRDIGKSTVLQAIMLLASKTEITTLSSLFLLTLAKNGQSMVPFQMFLLEEPNKPVKEVLNTTITDEERNNTVIDEYGAAYTIDGLKLISAPKDVCSYYIKEGTKVISNNAFARSKNLENIFIPNSVRNWDVSSFYSGNRPLKINILFNDDKKEWSLIKGSIKQLNKNRKFHITAHRGDLGNLYVIICNITVMKGFITCLVDPSCSCIHEGEIIDQSVFSVYKLTDGNNIIAVCNVNPNKK